MNKQYFYYITSCLLGLMLSFSFFSCKDDEKDNTELALLSSNIENNAVVSRTGTIELIFNKSVKQAAGTTISLNGEPIRIIIIDNVVHCSYNFSYETACTLNIPSGALTDLNGNSYVPGLTLNFTIQAEEVAPRLFDAVVDLNGDGNGTYKSVQEAINKAPDNLTSPYLIFVANGVYKEFVNVPKSKPFIHLIGQDKEKTIITHLLTSASDDKGDGGAEAWDNSWRNAANNGYQEAVTMIFATDFYAENISFENQWGIEKLVGPMAEAMYTANDRIAFYNCKFRSFQDTWQTKVQVSSANNGINARQYATDCWIEGAVDYFYGNGNVLIENTTFYNVRYGSVLTAGSHPEGTLWGYVFNNCTIDGINKVDPERYGTTSLDYIPGKGVAVTLGRPWQNAPITVYLNTRLNIDIDPAGWRDMGTVPALYAEYKTMGKDGNPVDMSQRKTSYLVNNVAKPYTGKTELSESDAVKYTYQNIITGSDGWDPRKKMEKVPTPVNVKLEGTTLSWTASKQAVCYLIFDGDKYVAETIDTSITVKNADGKYSVKAVNRYGSLSK